MDLREEKNGSNTGFSGTTEKSSAYLWAVIGCGILLVVLLLIGCAFYCAFCRDRSSENNTSRKERSKKKGSQKKSVNNSSKGKHHRLSHRHGNSRHNRNTQSRSKPRNLSSKVARMTSSEVIRLPPNVKLT
ncbi:hypothetical protein TYRP_012503 [Tyrophagus putrescentiae]|nr:hypothetical protein TYRP_012503 [Tyrophagus putrescentiae]